jgi:hypothetical protein
MMLWLPRSGWSLIGVLLLGIVVGGALLRRVDALRAPSGQRDGVPAPVTSFPAVPDAGATVSFATLDELTALLALAKRTGLVDPRVGNLTSSGLMDAGIAPPLVVSFRRSNQGMIIAARIVDERRARLALLQALVAMGMVSRRTLGAVDSIDDEDGKSLGLLRLGADTLLFAPSPVDSFAVAAFLETMASVPGAQSVEAVNSTAFTLGPTGFLQSARGTLDIDDNLIVVHASLSVTGEAAAFVSGLHSPPPDTACAVENGAIIAVRLPPLSGWSQDGVTGSSALGVETGEVFDGRVVVALHLPSPPTPVRLGDRASVVSLAVAAKPRSGSRGVLEGALDSPMTQRRQVGGRHFFDIAVADKPWRAVSAVVDDERFALGVGTRAVVERAAGSSSCPQNPDRLLSIDGPRLREAAVRARQDPELWAALVRLAAVADHPTLWDGLLKVDRWEVDARPVTLADGAATLDVTIRLLLPDLG